MTLPPVRRARELGVSAERAFTALTNEIGAWWPLATHSALQDASASLAFSGAELVETGPGGERHVWGEVLRWEPPHGLIMTWHPGRASGPAASEVELRVTPLAERRCLVEVLHRGWEEDVDATRFEALVSRGRAALAGGDPEAAVIALQEASGLWHGAPLPDVDGAAFAQPYVSHLEQLRRSADEDRLRGSAADRPPRRSRCSRKRHNACWSWARRTTSRTC